MLAHILLFFHIAFAATWFGTGLTLPGDIRRTLALGAPHFDPLVARVKRVSAIASGAGVLTILSGLAVIFAMGGFGEVPSAIDVGLAVSLLMVVVAVVGIARPWNEMVAKAAQGTDPKDLLPLAGRVSMGAGIFQLLWAVALATMVFHNLAG
jgi:hypothetical protein